MNQEFLEQLLNLNNENTSLNEYEVEFYSKDKVIVKATNFSTAEILAMASRIHQGKDWGVKLITNTKTGSYSPSQYQTH